MSNDFNFEEFARAAFESAERDQQRAASDELAGDTFYQFDAFRRAGFDDDQAMELTVLLFERILGGVE